MSDAEIQREIDDPVMSIGVLAQRVGLSVSAVRKYEAEGLIIAHRSDSGHRLFSHEDTARVRNIQHMIHGGLNLEGIRRMQALLPCWELLPAPPRPEKPARRTRKTPGRAGRSKGSTAPRKATNAGSAWSTGSARCAPRRSNASCTTRPARKMPAWPSTNY